ncbi:MAG: response regulator [Thermoplasmata archaeon]
MKEDVLILLVEDDRVDALTVKRAFKELKVTNPVAVTGNGEEALEYLRNKDNKQPGIILLDLNMPKMNGLEFLDAAKKDNELKSIPVIVLTTSKEEQDKMESYSHSVAGYIIKPVDYKKFVEAMRTVRLYWTLNELPDQV